MGNESKDLHNKPWSWMEIGVMHSKREERKVKEIICDYGRILLILYSDENDSEV